MDKLLESIKKKETTFDELAKKFGLDLAREIRLLPDESKIKTNMVLVCANNDQFKDKLTVGNLYDLRGVKTVKNVWRYRMLLIVDDSGNEEWYQYKLFLNVPKMILRKIKLQKIVSKLK